MKKCNEKIENVKTINVIFVRLTRGEGDGTTMPYHSAYQFYLKDGTFIGEISPITSPISELEPEHCLQPFPKGLDGK